MFEIRLFLQLTIYFPVSLTHLPRRKIVPGRQGTGNRPDGAPNGSLSESAPLLLLGEEDDRLKGLMIQN